LTTPPETNSTPDGREVAELMDAIRERVAEKKAAGLYSLDGLASRTGSATEPFHVQDLIWLDEVAEIRPDLDLVQSTKPGVGAVVGKAKGKLARATSQPLLDLAVRQSQFNAALLAYLTELAQEVTTLRARVRELEDGSREPS
jgi:hypothetical protein